MNNEQKIALAERTIDYCKKFNVPISALFKILEDQKVTPMIRGKAMEYNACEALENVLSNDVWSVDKLNLNAQNNAHDEDVSITHRRTGIILKVESKSAVRGSIKSGGRSRKMNVPHFNVKCHRSRSNISLAGSSNDRYAIDTFDIIISTPENSIFQGNTVGETLELIHNEDLQQLLFDHYTVNSSEALITACRNDWRFCVPADIGEDGFIPRTPYVKLSGDENWKPIADIEATLLEVVETKRDESRVKRSAVKRSSRRK